jgi:LacI family transcriptional regulator
VLDAAEQLDFAPNFVARGLVAQRTYLVGVVVHDLVAEYAAELARGLEETAEENGFTTVAFSTDADARRELDIVRRLRSLRADAVVYACSTACHGDELDELIAQLRRFEDAGGVIVRLAPHPSVGPDASVSTRKAVGLAVDHLVGLGHRRVGLVTGPEGMDTTKVLVHAMREVMKARDLTLAPELVLATDGTVEGGRAIATALAAQRRRPTGVVCADDLVAIGVLRGAHDAGLAVPEHLSVVGFYDIPLAAYVRPALTTVRVPLRELGAMGMQVAIWLLGGGARKGRLNLPVELVVRESAGPARARRAR